MPSFRSGTVTELVDEREGLQRVLVDLGGDEPERAYALTALTGPVAVGDRVVCNTTAVELGLGTGGWHVVHWNLSREEWATTGPGHIMKVRYTSLQSDTGCVEEHDRRLAAVDRVDGMPVVACALHSQLPAVATAFKEAAPDARLVYAMSDGASLPLALSDTVADLRRLGLVDATVTYGHAFGGDLEAVNVHSALAAARVVAGADAVVTAMGPGIVGTDTALGTTGLEVGQVLDAASALGAVPIACLRVSFADARERHRGVSHHSVSALGVACRSRVTIPLPTVGGAEEERLRAELAESGLDARHDVVPTDAGDVLGRFDRHGLTVSSMGRPAASDPVLYACGAAAGLLAAARVKG